MADLFDRQLTYLADNKIFAYVLTVYLTYFDASAFRKLSSIYVFSYFPFGFEGGMWDLIVSVPDHCLSFYFLFISFHLF